MTALREYARSLTQGECRDLTTCEFFAKVLTRNDDSGRHGVLIPSDAYSFFPDFQIPNPSINATIEFQAVNSITGSQVDLAYKYYERYPERRLTRLDRILNDLESGPRIMVVMHAKFTDGTSRYYFDSANSAADGRFESLFQLIFGYEITPLPGIFIIRPIDSKSFSIDEPLQDLLNKFDEVKGYGWVDTLRGGDTGVGYTFETLIGIKENNDKFADFRGIEIKCKGMKELNPGGNGKINIFQSGPIWTEKSSMKNRIRMLGVQGVDGLFSCYSQVTPTENNIGLLLSVVSENSKIDLKKFDNAVGHWSFQQLETRLTEKHARTVFVKAKSRNTKTTTQFLYDELVYCDEPSIERFIDLVVQRNIVFEFLMSEKPGGSIRNHGYPWRLIREEFLEQLFAFQIKLR